MTDLSETHRSAEELAGHPGDGVPLVSVVIPAYNAERYLAETLRSVLTQTHREIEVLVVDDGSTDGTAAVAAAAGDPRVRVLRYENGGSAAARNRGLSHVRGEFVAFLDADDLFDPEKLEVQLGALTEPSVVCVGCRMRYVSADSGRTFAESGEPTQGRQADIAAARFMPFPISSALVRTDAARAAGGFDEELKSVGDDLDFVSRLAAHGRIDRVPEVLGSYRVSSASITGSGHRNMQMIASFVEARAAARLSGAPVPDLQAFTRAYRPTLSDWRQQLGARLFRAAGLAAVNAQYPSAARMFAASLVVNPIYTLRRVAMRLGLRGA